MRTSFELKFPVNNLEGAKEDAITAISKFLQIDKNDVLDAVNIEIKVSYPESKTYAEMAEHVDLPLFVATVYGSVKQSIVKPFGL